MVSHSDLNRIVVVCLFFFSFSRFIQCDQWSCVWRVHKSARVWNGEGLWIELNVYGQTLAQYKIPNWNSCHECAQALAHTSASIPQIRNERDRKKKQTLKSKPKQKHLLLAALNRRPRYKTMKNKCSPVEWDTLYCVHRVCVCVLFDFSRQFNKIRNLNYASLVFAKQFNKSTLKYPLISIKWNYSRVLFQNAMAYD